MTAHPEPSAFARDTSLLPQERRSLLRFVVCGSVDHGKSTLIGRLLYEAGLLFDDQLDSLAAESHKYGTQGRDLDFSLLLDGLAAEREQKITIDVAYRFFSTERRKFIVADAPGHEQYTRNMATGASTADLALILVNAQAGLTRQTRRHSLIVSTLGVRHVVVAVNKMDLVGWSEEAFRTIEAEFRALADELGVDQLVCIPISARSGDNVVSHSPHMDWYRGSPLLTYLEEVEIGRAHRRPFRMPVQLVNRPNAEFRGYSGLIAGGEAFSGMPVRILPSGQTTTIDRIVTFDGDLDRAAVGQSVTLTLTEEIDVSRGDTIVELGDPPATTTRLAAQVIWMGKDALTPGRSYLVKLGTATAKARVEAPLHVLDLETFASASADRLFINDVGHCVLTLDRPVSIDRYAENRDTGSFILIDPESYDTLGMGLVEQVVPEEVQRGWLRRLLGATARVGPVSRVSARSSESHTRSIAKAISWRGTGSVDTFIVTFIVTGNYVFAGSVAVAEIMTKIMLYYLHERIWSLIPWGKSSSA
jgi:sulfate adenylyltransferase large subunit